MKSIIKQIQIKDYRNERIDIHYRRECEIKIYELKDPEDSLIMGNKELSTIPEKESDEVIKPSVEDFVPIPSESEDISGSDSEVLEDIKNKDSYLDEPNLLVTPLSDANENECLDLGDDVDEIELLLHSDPSTPKMSVASILEGYGYLSKKTKSKQNEQKQAREWKEREKSKPKANSSQIHPVNPLT
nr:hypothetical protein [Tanacetum cinerariifolium]